MCTRKPDIRSKQTTHINALSTLLVPPAFLDSRLYGRKNAVQRADFNTWREIWNASMCVIIIDALECDEISTGPIVRCAPVVMKGRFSLFDSSDYIFKFWRKSIFMLLADILSSRDCGYEVAVCILQQMQ